jgi:hypothetical protein
MPVLSLVLLLFEQFVCACCGGGAWSGAGAAVVDARFRVPAVDLLFSDARGGSLADRLPKDSDTGIGSGFFGKVGAFTHHGAAVAVKELKSGTLDTGSIGAQRDTFFRAGLPESASRVFSRL